MSDKSAWKEADIADRRTLRHLFGRFLTGVTIVTTYDENNRARGFTANSFTSVSLDPPLVLICIANGAGSFQALTTAERFGINILGEGQRDLATRFASPIDDKFEHVEVVSRLGSAPLIGGSLGSLDCERQALVPAGDHTIVIGRVLAFRTNPGTPLGYYRGNYVALGLDPQALSDHGSKAMVLGCLLEADGKVLLCRRPGRPNWELPTAGLDRGEDHRKMLPRLLRKFNLNANLSLLYSVYQEGDEPHVTMIFKGQITEPCEAGSLPDGTELRLFDEAEQPWELLTGSSPRNVVRRFFEERRGARFGIYWETEHGGQVAPMGGEPRPWVRTASADK